MKKIGIDLGSSSLGWAIRDDEEIIKEGVITFSTGMVIGTGRSYSSPTRDRREARSKRNLIRSRKYRKWELLKVMIKAEMVPLSQEELDVWSKYKKGRTRKFPESKKFLNWLACNFTYEGNENYQNPYQLRIKAIDHKLSKHQFGRALYHIVQRRGYKDIGESDKETKNQIERREEDGFSKAMQENRSVAEALTNEFLKKDKRARNQYPYREEYRDELELICKGQGYDISKNAEEGYNDSFVQSLWKAIIWQRPLDIQKGNIGKCTLEPSKLRCPISHPVYEIFRAWQFINNIKYYNDDGIKVPLSSELRRSLFFEVFLKKEANFKFEKIKVFLDKKFKKARKYNYPRNRKTGEYDTPVSGMPVCKGLINIFGEDAKKPLDSIEQYNIGNAPKVIEGYSIYDLWHILFDFDKRTAKDENFLEKFANEKLNVLNKTKKRRGKEISISPLVELRGKFLQGYAELSLKAIRKIIPFLKKGYLYSDAVVLAKIPELLKDDWLNNRDLIFNTLKESNQIYEYRKKIIRITNNLINKHKGWVDGEKHAFKDYEYTLKPSDVEDVKIACKGFFGENSWDKVVDKEEIIQAVGFEYQDYFYDHRRGYRKHPTLTDIFKSKLKENDIELVGDLYHHSNIKNRYTQNLETNWETGEKYLPTKNGIEVLPIPYIDSIKNPMFNKSMSVLRKLINELIIAGQIDQETEVIIELARELNDNNKRAAIERYQGFRRKNREKYREFLEEFKQNENAKINVEDSIPVFELWIEQISKKEKDKNGKEINRNTEILKEKNALKRYELWIEQERQCMYTGKMISISQLFSNEIDIMHTIPRSLLPDNTMTNMTVGYATYNRDLQKEKLPKQCDNYFEDKEGWGKAIEPRLYFWKEERDKWKSLYESRKRPKGNEDEDGKNKRIQDRHYYKMHFDYWKDKVERFESDEVKDGWARRQLVDTQMVSKYAREFLKLFFKKVAVQKGAVTADFRKLLSFQEEDEIKNRSKHTHHAIDAAVLTLIPVNSSYRDLILKKYYNALENNDKIALEKLRQEVKPSQDFNPQVLIKKIERETLIVNYKKDRILNQAKKKVRKRGRIQYVKDKNNKFILDENGKRIIKYAQGDTVRSELYAQTYLGKIKDVERNDDEQPIRENGDWKYKTGKDEFIFVKRESIDDIKSSESMIDKIVDPTIKKLVREQKDNAVVKDYQGNAIRHVRIKTKAGREVKKRVNFKSKHSYKNKFYSEAGSIPYALLLQKVIGNKIDRKMIPIASYEIAKVFKAHKKFTPELYLKTFHKELTDFPDLKLMKVGQKVLVLNDDEDFDRKEDLDFQINRLYQITQFKYDGSKILLKYHLEARSKKDIDSGIKKTKDSILKPEEQLLGISLIREDETIQDVALRKKDYIKRLYDFPKRLNEIEKKAGIEKAKLLKEKISEYKTESSSIILEGQTPILGLSKNNWNFLFEDYDFEINLLGEISKWYDS